MKKTLIITAAVIAAFFLALLILPFAFKGKIEAIVKTEASAMLDATVDFSGVSLSFIRNFPNASISVDNFSVVGKGEFEGDTLTRINRTAVVVNLMSIFGDNGYEVKRIDIINPYVFAKVLPNGKANWDIMPTDSTATGESADSSSAFKLQLQKLNIENARIIYEDLQGNMRADIKHLNLTLSGDMTESQTKLKINADTDALSFVMDKIPYLTGAQFTADMVLDADLDAMKFTFTENEFNLNGITLDLDGWLAMLDDGFDMDLKLNTPKVDFKSVLSLVPAIYAKDFASIKADGKVALSGFAKGIYNEKQMPAFDVTLLVENAWFRYPDLPKQVENININLQASNPDGNLEHTAVDVHQFAFAVDGNPFAVTANVKGLTDPAFNFTARGKFNLGTVKDFYPLDSMSLSGLLTADMNGAGLMSQVENEQYDKLKFGGTFALADMTLKTAALKDEVNIKNAQLTFNPKVVNLNALDVTIGQNDIAASGNLENFIAYVLLDKTIRGTLSVRSNYLNLNDFLPTETPAEPAAETPAEAAPAGTAAASDTLAVIEIPKNIDFTMSADFKKIIYDKIELDNSLGQMIARDGILSLKNVTTHAFDGTMTMNGAYNTQDMQNPAAEMALNMKDVTLAKLFKQVNTIQKLAPIFENMSGTFGIDLNFRSPLAADMMPVLDKMVADGTLSSNNFSVSNVKVLDALAAALKKESLKTITAKDLKIHFAVADGRVATKPFDIKMGDVKMNLSGSTGLDQTIDYVAKVALPNNLTANIPVTVGVKIGGTFTSPKIGLDGSSLMDTAKDLIKDKVGEQVDALKEKANEELQKLLEQATAKKDALVAAAQENAQKLRDEAAKQGEALVAAAQKKADEGVAAAGDNLLKKAAAQKLGQTLVNEAKKQADNLQAKANDAATKLETTAQTEGDKLIQAAQDKGAVAQ